MKALSANSSPVMSLAICSFPLSPRGDAIEMCRTKVLITYLTMEFTLHDHRKLAYPETTYNDSPRPSVIAKAVPGEDLRLDKGQFLGQFLDVRTRSTHSRIGRTSEIDAM